MDSVITTLCLLATVQGKALEPQVLRLGSEEFRIREDAHRVIAKQLDVAWGEVLAKGLQKSSNDLETDCRVKVLTRKWGMVTEYGQFPWICALPKGYPDREKIISTYMDKARGVQGPDYPQHRYATYLYLMDLKSKGYWNSSLQAIQRLQIPNELYWYEHHTYPR